MQPQGVTVLSKKHECVHPGRGNFLPDIEKNLGIFEKWRPRHPPCDNALFFSTGRAGPTIWELRRICRRCAGAGVTDDRQYATAPHVCSITYRYAYTETYYMQFL